MNTRLGSHELVLLSEVSGNIMNMDVMNQQTAYRNSIYGLETTIAATKAAFSEDQKQYYTLLMKENGFDNIKVIKDLAGLDRVVLGRKR